MTEYKCGNCGKVWSKKELLYEPLLKMYKCPECKIFTPLYEIKGIGWDD